MSIRWRLAGPLIAVLVGVSAWLLLSPGGGRSQPARIPGPIGGYVDRESVGGQCDDKRAPAQARSPQRPWCSLERAMAAAPPGTSVVVRRGTYPELVARRVPGRSRYVTMRAAPGEAVRLGRVRVEGAQYMAVVGFRLTAGFSFGPGSHHIRVVDNTFEESSVLIQEGVHDVRLEGNRISNRDGNGVVFSSARGEAPIRNVAIRRNRFDGIGIDAIQIKNFDRVVIEGNEFARVKEVRQAEHPDVLQSFGGGRRLVFRRNYLHDIHAQGFFIKDGHVDDVIVENNLFVRFSGQYAINIYDTSRLRLANNTVWSNELDVVLREGVQARMFNNIFESLVEEGRVRYAYADHNLILRGPLRGRHSIRRPPLFDARYGLRRGSPGVDAGTSAGAPSRDRLGRARRDDPRAPNRGTGRRRYVDMGAHERTGR